MRRLSLAGLLLATLAWAGAAIAVEPFQATYDVVRNGRTIGEATLQVVPSQAGRWRVDLIMDGTGLFGVAGLHARQSTVFDEAGGTYRPLAQSTSRKVLFSRKESAGTYNWASGQARWRGDVKAHRRAPVQLRPGDMSGLLINLAVIRDAEPGRTLRYRYVDTGRVRDHEYTVAAVPEQIPVGELTYNALRVDRLKAAGEQTSIWVAEGVPTPIRILQSEEGEDTYDLRLVEYKGT